MDRHSTYLQGLKAQKHISWPPRAVLLERHFCVLRLDKSSESNRLIIFSKVENDSLNSVELEKQFIRTHNHPKLNSHLREHSCRSNYKGGHLLSRSPDVPKWTYSSSFGYLPRGLSHCMS